jgi:hypothetical protein
MKPCILITAYQLVDYVELNIQRIRNEYKLLNDVEIVIVSTSEVDVGYKEMVEKYEKVHLIEFPDAPKYEAIYYDNGYEPPSMNVGISLTKRIFLSMEKGLKKLDSLGCNICLHLHGDTYWDSKKEKNLYNILKEVYDGDLLFSGDLWDHDPNSGLDRYTLFHPQGLVIHIPNSKKYNFIEFNKIWNSSFVSKNYGSSEMLIGEYAEFCLSGKILKNEGEKHSEIYYKKVKVRDIIPHHGEFESGIVNFNIKQR